MPRSSLIGIGRLGRIKRTKRTKFAAARMPRNKSTGAEIQKAFVSRLYESLGKLEGARDRRADHLRHLEEQYQSAWSDSFRDRVQGWMDEERGNIHEIEEKIRSVRDKIDEASRKL